MKVVKWKYKNQIMKDCYFLKIFQLSQHFKGNRFWTYEFHWKNSHAWYSGFKRHSAKDAGAFRRTRLTFRFGKRLLVIGSRAGDEIYYKDVEVVSMMIKGVYTYVNMKFQSELTDSAIKIGGRKGLASMQALHKYFVKQLVKPRKPWTGDVIIGSKVKLLTGYDYWHLNKDYPEMTWRN